MSATARYVRLVIAASPAGRMGSAPIGCTLLAAVALCLAACGGSGNGSARVRTGAAAAGGAETVNVTVDADHDDDNRSGSHYDADEHPYLSFGHPAGGTELSAIESMLRSFYAASAAGDGVRACRLVYSLERETIVERYDESTLRRGPPLKTCAAVAAKTFIRAHRELAAKRASLRFVRVGVQGELGVAVLAFGGGSERYLLLHKEAKWKTVELSDVEIP